MRSKKILIVLLILSGLASAIAFKEAAKPGALIENQEHAFYVGDKKYEIAAPAGGTVYDLMNLLRQRRSDFAFQGKNSPGLGFFVEEINGLKNNPSRNTYWLYYVNGTLGEVGISNYVLKPNDVINWKYEKPEF